ncbi:O-antigen ligase family protein [Pelotomaculum terephthalicicum JT]|uniref:O-antigen ligase family protein n=1 Tax=Pelotomaculum terephthalicicum TaxID=206393 RepID=UPI001F038B57|nr:O-antigen ligase family protein [Pelotomaculum terephthalicicum]MCG9966649.1 O-antigen ligase family protein [Pelotomaculum terephthalicicum JT]
MPKVIAKGKKKSAVVKKTPESDQWEIVRATAFWGLAILLFLPPYFRGLFFQPEQERALIFAAVIFWFAWLWKWSKRDNEFLSHPLDYFVLAFPIVYFISAFQAANYGLAVDEVVKTTLYFLVYWLASRLIRDEKDITTILQVIYISAIGVALAGLATTTGIININDGFKDGRIYSSFQYPNALASYLASVVFIGFYLWRRAGSPESGGPAAGLTKKEAVAWINLNSFYQYLYVAGNFILFTVLLGTKSNGGLLVFSAVFFLFLIGLPKGTRIPALIHFILISVPAFLAIWGFLSAVTGGKMDLAWLWVFVGLAITVAGQALYGFTERKGLLQWIAAHRNAVLAVVALVIVAGCIGTGVYVSGHSDAVKSLAEEIRLRNATERMYFFQDAMKMFKERPIIGWGGGGWQEAYRVYQSYLYNSNQVHGHYFQIMVEAGVLGLLAILGIWASFLMIAHRLYHGAKENSANRFLIWTITIAAVSIGLHAVIDFDLSLSALAVVLWTMFGFVRGIGIYSSARAEEKKSRKYVPPNNAVLAGASIASIVLILFTGVLAAAGDYAKQAGQYLQKQNVNQAISLYQKAISYNPLNASYRMNLAAIYQQQGKIDESIAEAQKAVEISKYNAQLYVNLPVFYLNGNKNNEEAVNAAEKTLSLAPFQIQGYESLARTYFIVGYNELTAGNPEAAKQHFEKAVEVPARIQSQMESLNAQEKRLWRDAPMLSPTPGVKLNVGASQYFLGMWTEAEVNLQESLQDEKTKGEAALWLSLLKDKQGKVQEADNLLQQAKQSAPQMAQSYEGLRNLQILK